jgi:hypothetical protein
MPKGEFFYSRGVHLSRTKAFVKSEKFSKLRNACENPILIFWPKANNIEKFLSKVCKIKYKWCIYGPKC